MDNIFMPEHLDIMKQHPIFEVILKHAVFNYLLFNIVRRSQSSKEMLL
jgi:hypothetical protein